MKETEEYERWYRRDARGYAVKKWVPWWLVSILLPCVLILVLYIAAIKDSGWLAFGSMSVFLLVVTLREMLT